MTTPLSAADRERLRAMAADLADLGNRVDLWSRRDAPSPADQADAAQIADHLHGAAVVVRRVADSPAP